MSRLFISLSIFISLSANSQLPFKNDSLYKTVYAKELCNLMAKHPDLLFVDVRSAGEYSDTSQYTSLNLGHIVDVRPAVQFQSKDTLLQNNVGRIKNAINIPYAEFKNR